MFEHCLIFKLFFINLHLWITANSDVLCITRLYCEGSLVISEISIPTIEYHKCELVCIVRFLKIFSGTNSFISMKFLTCFLIEYMIFFFLRVTYEMNKYFLKKLPEFFKIYFYIYYILTYLKLTIEGWEYQAILSTAFWATTKSQTGNIQSVSGILKCWDFEIESFIFFTWKHNWFWAPQSCKIT